jgi:hypothetical protein
VSHPVLVSLVQTDPLTVRCTVTRYGGDDPAGVTVHPVVNALSMRSAQRTLTTRMKADGYTPVGRWVTAGNQSTRTFREGTS